MRRHRQTFQQNPNRKSRRTERLPHPATALASRVLPVPGGPTKITPFGMRAPTPVYFCGFFRKSTISSSSSFSSSRPGNFGKVDLAGRYHPGTAASKIHHLGICPAAGTGIDKHKQEDQDACGQSDRQDHRHKIAILADAGGRVRNPRLAQRISTSFTSSTLNSSRSPEVVSKTTSPVGHLAVRADLCALYGLIFQIYHELRIA